MKSIEVCKWLGISKNRLRHLVDALDMKGVGSGKVKRFSELERVRLKAGIDFKDYTFVKSLELPWVYYGFLDDKEIKIEI